VPVIPMKVFDRVEKSSGNIKFGLIKKNFIRKAVDQTNLFVVKIVCIKWQVQLN